MDLTQFTAFIGKDVQLFMAAFDHQQARLIDRDAAEIGRFDPQMDLRFDAAVITDCLNRC